MQLLDDLFVNLCILGMLLFTLHILVSKRNGFISPSVSFSRRFHFGISMGVLGVILMHYTIHFQTTILDLRQVPVLVAAIYGGWFPPLLAALIIAMGRILLFGMSATSVTAAVLIIFIGITCAALSRLRINSAMKWLVLTFANLLLTSVVFYLLIPEKTVLLKVYIGYWLISLIGGIIIHILCEFLRQTKETYQSAQKNAAIDFLTGLYNAREFNEALKMVLKRADLKQENVSYILLDIDHFKQVNDTEGHLAGDEVLQQISQILRKTCRSMDIVSRIGGEEFSIILPSCPASRAYEIAENIRSAVERQPMRLSNGSTIHITISLGIATYLETAFQPESLMKQADDCLYLAKNKGRNTAVLQH